MKKNSLLIIFLGLSLPLFSGHIIDIGKRDFRRVTKLNTGVLTNKHRVVSVTPKGHTALLHPVNVDGNQNAELQTRAVQSVEEDKKDNKNDAVIHFFDKKIPRYRGAVVVFERARSGFDHSYEGAKKLVVQIMQPD